MINVVDLTGGYGEAFQIKDIQFQVERGEFFGIIGPNGSGKTTLVKMLSGILTPDQGHIEIDGRRLESYRPKELAKKLAVLPQLTEQSFRFTVKETVALGRYAHQTGLFANLSKEDEAIVEEVMAYTDVLAYAHLTIDQLSGGERQRVFLAQALAQQPEIIILDEPTNHLDLMYQKELLDLLQAWTKENKLTVLSIFHDLNIASLYCDRLLLLNRGEMHVCDLPNEVIQQEHIWQVYGTEVENQTHPLVPRLQLMLTPEREADPEPFQLDETYLRIHEAGVSYESPLPLKTISTHVQINGSGWYDRFKNYYLPGSRSEGQLPVKLGKQAAGSLVTYFPAYPSRCLYRQIQKESVQLFLLVMIADLEGVPQPQVQSHNFWLFIHGKILDYQFYEAIAAITRGKLRANADLGLDPHADLTQLDQMTVAATQKTSTMERRLSTLDLSKTIEEAVYQLLLESPRSIDLEVNRPNSKAKEDGVPKL